MKENKMAFNPQGKKLNQQGFDNNPVDYSGDYSSQDDSNTDNQKVNNIAPKNSGLASQTKTDTNVSNSTSQNNYVRSNRRFGQGNSNTSTPVNAQETSSFAPRRFAQNSSAQPAQPSQRPSAQPSQFAPKNNQNENLNGGTQRFSKSEHSSLTQQANNRRESALNSFKTAGSPYERSSPSPAYQAKLDAGDNNMRFSFWGNAKTNQPMRYPFKIESPTPFVEPKPVNLRVEDESFIPTRVSSGFEDPFELTDSVEPPKNPPRLVKDSLDNSKPTSSAAPAAFHKNRNAYPEQNHAPEEIKIVTEAEQMGSLFSNEKIIKANIVSSIKTTGNNTRFAILPSLGLAKEPVNLKDTYQKLTSKIDEEQNIINIELNKLREEQAIANAAAAELKKVKKTTKKDESQVNENNSESPVESENTNSKDNITAKKRAPNTNFKTKNIVDGSQFQTHNIHNFEGVEVSDLEKSGLALSELLNLSNIQINERVRFNIQELSTIPVELLLELLGAKNVDKNIWDLEKHKIETQDKSFKWFNQTTNKGSIGSINLMKHLIATENEILEHENDSTLFKASCQKLTALLPELLSIYDKRNADTIIQQETEKKQQYLQFIKAIDNLPLLDIMNYFQGKNHHKGIAGRWKVNANNNVYSIGSAGWYSFTESIGGKGAIGFAAHAMATENNLNYGDKDDVKKLRRLAINMLKQEFKNDIDLDGNYDDVPVFSGDYKVPFSMPLVIPQKQNQVRNYLHDQRGLPNWIINKQMAAGVLFPGFPSDWKNTPNLKDTENLEDKNVWAVFLAMNGNAAEMRAIDRYDGTAKLLAKGSEKEAGGHLVKAEKDFSEGMVCSLEAAIDACSYASIFPGRVTNSCMGVNYNLAASMAVETLESGYKYGFCFDNDLAGNVNNWRFKQELISRIGEEEYNDFYKNNKIEYFQLGVLCLKEQVYAGQRFYFDVNYDVDGKETFKMFHDELVKEIGLNECKKLYQEGSVFAYNATPTFSLIKDNNIQAEAIKVAELLLNEKKPIYFVTEEPTLDKSEADFLDKIEEHKISLIKHNAFMTHFKNHLGSNYLTLQKKGSIIKNVNSFAKDWNEYLNKMKKLYPEFAQEQKNLEDKFANVYTNDIQLELVAGKVKKKP